MTNLKTELEFEDFKRKNSVVLLYFSTAQCNVCKVLKPKLIDFIESKFPKISMGFIDSALFPNIAAQNQVFAAPTILLLMEGKEFIRKSRNISLSELYDDIKRPYSMFFEE